MRQGRAQSLPPNPKHAPGPQSQPMPEIHIDEDGRAWHCIKAPTREELDAAAERRRNEPPTPAYQATRTVGEMSEAEVRAVLSRVIELLRAPEFDEEAACDVSDYLVSLGL